jgi:hypothetical protein
VSRAAPAPERRLEALIRCSPWLMDVLATVRAVDPPQWWVGGGVLRDLVWDGLAGGFEPHRVRDVDVAFFDPADLSPERDREVDRALRAVSPAVPWEATNQAAVHTWYGRRFGFDVPALLSSADGVATWPETATAVAVRLRAGDDLEFTAVPGGIADLVNGVCRRNPRRVDRAEYLRRLQRKDVARRWPQVAVVRD